MNENNKNKRSNLSKYLLCFIGVVGILILYGFSLWRVNHDQRIRPHFVEYSKNQLIDIDTIKYKDKLINQGYQVEFLGFQFIKGQALDSLYPALQAEEIPPYKADPEATPDCILVKINLINTNKEPEQSEIPVDISSFFLDLGTEYIIPDFVLGKRINPKFPDQGYFRIALNKKREYYLVYPLDYSKYDGTYFQNHQPAILFDLGNKIKKVKLV